MIKNTKLSVLNFLVSNKLRDLFLKQNIFPLERSRPATRRRGDFVTTSLCMSQWRRRYVLNETPNEVSVERRQDVSVVSIHGVLFYVSTTSPVSPKRSTEMTLLWYVSTPPRVGVTLLRRCLRSQVTLSWTQSCTFLRLI